MFCFGLFQAMNRAMLLCTDHPLQSSLFEKRSDAHTVLCWNIENGETNRLLKGRAGENGPLEKNLEAIFRDELSVDTLFFLEFSPRAMHPSVLSELEKLYPYPSIHYHAYNEKSDDLGIGVFSRKSLSLEKKIKS